MSTTTKPVHKPKSGGGHSPKSRAAAARAKSLLERVDALPKTFNGELMNLLEPHEKPWRKGKRI